MGKTEIENKEPLLPNKTNSIYILNIHVYRFGNLSIADGAKEFTNDNEFIATQCECVQKGLKSLSVPLRFSRDSILL